MEMQVNHQNEGVLYHSNW